MVSNLGEKVKLRILELRLTGLAHLYTQNVAKYEQERNYSIPSCIVKDLQTDADSATVLPHASVCTHENIAVLTWV